MRVHTAIFGLICAGAAVGLPNLSLAGGEFTPTILRSSDELSSKDACDQRGVLYCPESGYSTTGQISAADDCPLSGGTFADYYQFRDRPGSEVAIELNSSHFDAVLSVAGPDGIFNLTDNDSGLGTNARIVMVLESRERYTVEATTYTPGAEGEYTISIQCVRSYPEATIMTSFYPGIYWNPDRPGWGVTIDIQRGILFGAVFGYAESGRDAFLTLLSERVDPDTPIYRGDVFLSDQHGTDTRDVGDFIWEIAKADGQPAAIVDISSPYLNEDDFVLVRFGYMDQDLLSPIAGRLWGLSGAGSSSVLDRIGGYFYIAAHRGTEQNLGDVVLVYPGSGWNGVAGYDSQLGSYVVGLNEPISNDAVVLAFQATHTDLFGLAGYFAHGWDLVDETIFLGTAGLEDIDVTKSGPRSRLTPSEATRLLQRSFELARRLNDGIRKVPPEMMPAN